MAAQNSTTAINTPVAPQPILYVMFYRQGNNPHPQTKYFNFPSSDMKKVVERAKLHCERMSLRFVNVRPFYSDLDKEENILFNRDTESAEG